MATLLGVMGMLGLSAPSVAGAAELEAAADPSVVAALHRVGGIGCDGGPQEASAGSVTLTIIDGRLHVTIVVNDDIWPSQRFSVEAWEEAPGCYPDNALRLPGVDLTTDAGGSGGLSFSLPLPWTQQYPDGSVVTLGDGVGSERLVVVLDRTDSAGAGDSYSANIPLPAPSAESIVVNDSFGGALIDGEVTQPSQWCEPSNRLLVESTSAVWSSITLQQDATLATQAAFVGPVASVGLLPPGGVAAVGNVCFVRAGQRISVVADMRTTPALLLSLVGTIVGAAGIPLNDVAALVDQLLESPQRFPALFAAVDALGRGDFAGASLALTQLITDKAQFDRFETTLVAILGLVPGLETFAGLADLLWRLIRDAEFWPDFGSADLVAGLDGARVGVESNARATQSAVTAAEQQLAELDADLAANDIRTGEVEGRIAQLQQEFRALGACRGLDPETTAVCRARRIVVQDELATSRTKAAELRQTAATLESQRLRVDTDVRRLRVKLDDLNKLLTSIRRALDVVEPLFATVEGITRLASGAGSGRVYFDSAGGR